MFESTVAALTIYHDLQGQWLKAPLPQSVETPSIEPTKDGWIGITTYTGTAVEGLLPDARAAPSSVRKRSTTTRQLRMDHLEFIQDAMHAWLREAHDRRRPWSWPTRCGIPAAPIGNGKEVLEMDHFLCPRRLHREPGRLPATAPTLSPHPTAIDRLSRACPPRRSARSRDR